MKITTDPKLRTVFFLRGATLYSGLAPLLGAIVIIAVMLFAIGPLIIFNRSVSADNNSRISSTKLYSMPYIKNVQVQNLAIKDHVRFIKLKVAPNIVGDRDADCSIAFGGNEDRGQFLSIKRVVEILWRPSQSLTKIYFSDCSSGRSFPRVINFNNQRDIAWEFFSWFMSKNMKLLTFLIQKSSFVVMERLPCEIVRFHGGFGSVLGSIGTCFRRCCLFFDFLESLIHYRPLFIRNGSVITSSNEGTCSGEKEQYLYRKIEPWKAASITFWAMLFFIWFAFSLRFGDWRLIYFIGLIFSTFVYVIGMYLLLGWFIIG